MKLLSFILLTFLIDSSFAQGFTSSYVRVENIGFYGCLFNPFPSIHIYINAQNQDPSFWFDQAKRNDSLSIPFKISVLQERSKISFWIHDTISNRKTTTSFNVVKKTDSLITMSFIEFKHTRTFGIGCSRSEKMYQLIIQNNKVLMYYGDYFQPQNLILTLGKNSN